MVIQIPKIHFYTLEEVGMFNVGRLTNSQKSQNPQASIPTR
jgi:hypothetical protein